MTTKRHKRRNSKKLLLNKHRRAACAYCRRSIPKSEFVAEHAIPLCRGGVDKMENIVMACRTCDQLKGPLTADEFMSVFNDHAARKALIAKVHRSLRT